MRGVEILRHRTGLLCKRCQTILRSKQIHVSIKRRQKKNTLWRFFFIDKMLPVSLTQEPFSYLSYQECSVHTPMHTAEILKKCIDLFNFLTWAFLSWNRDKYFAFCWYLGVRISFILLLIKWSEMDSNVKPQTLVETFDQANSNSITECMSRLS